MGRTIEQAARDAALGKDETLYQACYERLAEKRPDRPPCPLFTAQVETEIRSMTPAELSLYDISEQQ